MKTSTLFGAAAGLCLGAIVGAGMLGNAFAQSQKSGPVTASGQQVQAGSASSVASGSVTIRGSANGSGSAQAGGQVGSVRNPALRLFVVTYDSTKAVPVAALMGHERYMAQAARGGTVLLDGVLERGVEMAVVQFADKAQASEWVSADPNVRDGTLDRVEVQSYAVIHEQFGGRGVITVPRPGGPTKTGGG
ncbi:MAG: hypothetical protein IT207_00670 [Fimbriimonadaceae bacterium]|nr:hypothetical protein [Fimbriimonadaceae bacterium]